MALALDAGAAAAAAEPRMLDDFEQLAGWQSFATEGVDLELAHDEGRTGRGMRLDFDFHGGAGYAIARKTLPVDLPANYEFSFFIRGAAPVNNLEFKLVDASGKNVWWRPIPALQFPAEWQPMTIKKRHLEFAWGPDPAQPLTHAAAIEIVVTAAEGGKGSVWIDELTLRPRPQLTEYDLTPAVSASTSAESAAPEGVLDGAGWRSGQLSEQQWLLLDFLRLREYGGLTIDWHPAHFARAYRVEVSDDGEQWETALTITQGNGGRDYLYLPDRESRWLRLSFEASALQQGYGIERLRVEPYDFSATPNQFFQSIARESRRGLFPRYFSGEQSYWTVVGVPQDDKEALINQEGMLEPAAGGFSISPLLFADGELITWADVSRSESLAENALPIPSVLWHHPRLELSMTAFASGAAPDTMLYARYAVKNTTAQHQHLTLYLALLPFQVNPPWQHLNILGGVAELRGLARRGDRLWVNAEHSILPLNGAPRFGAVSFDQGLVTEALQRGELPAGDAAADPLGFASGALAYDLDLAPGASRTIAIALPLHRPDLPVDAQLLAAPEEQLERLRARALTEWRNLVNRVEFDLPADARAYEDTLKSTLAYTLINQDGPALQPGSRAYQRSWIRDGALTGAALLRLGHPDPVKRFIEWYAAHQFPSGKVPCCVDHRGADPVPEHDSNGLLIYAIMEYYRFTRDIGLLVQLWPNVMQAVAYLEQLRAQRRTAQYETGEQRLFYGLLPESISHEGYAAHPMHSYWDDFFALRGLKDAARMAAVLGYPEQALRLAQFRDDFRTDLYASLNLAIERHGIDYIPGAAELGDFDAPSTSISVAPVGELAHLPHAALIGTLDRWFGYFSARRDGSLEWENMAPYEWRLVETYVRLDQRERAHELMEFLMQLRRPAAWNQWPEIVWRDPLAPRYLGDLPHTWVGSDFIRALRALFVYEREGDEALVLGAGIPADWLTDSAGVTLRRLPTYYGTLNYRLRPEGENALRWSIGGDVVVPPGGIVLSIPPAMAPEQILTEMLIDGAPADLPVDGHFTLRKSTAEIVLRYAPAPADPAPAATQAAAPPG